MSELFQPGALIEGKYRVVRRMGEGGMGTVYEGENARIERRVAIKVLHPQVAATPEFAERFAREARAAARIGSPHVCDVLDLGELPTGERYIVMEYLDGESLEERLGRGLLTATDIAPIAFEVMEGLRTMHAAGVIHRDLKPANVFLARKPGRGRGETVKILDFGVAKLLPRPGEQQRMTATGVMIGTPLYMSPEQARGSKEVDGRTDIYAASVMFYRALTGVMPHAAANLHELLFKIVLEEPKPIVELVPSADPEFSAIVMQGLRRDPNMRFLNPRAYQEAIAAWGRTKNNPLLSFELSDSVRPPLGGGGTPMPAPTPIEATQLSPVSPAPAFAPPSPVVTRTLIHESTPRPAVGPALGATAMATPAARANGAGTPIGFTKTPTSQRQGEASQPSPAPPPGTSAGPTGTAPMAPPLHASAPPPPAARASSAAIAGGIVVAAFVLGGAFVATRLLTAGGGGHAASASASASAEPLPSITASAEPPPPASTTAPPLPPPPASVEPEASAVPSAAPTIRPNRGIGARAPAAPSAAPSATSVPSASATTINGRKIRTTLD